MGSSGLQEGTGVGWLDTVLSASSVKGQVALCLAVSRREDGTKCLAALGGLTEPPRPDSRRFRLAHRPLWPRPFRSRSSAVFSLLHSRSNLSPAPKILCVLVIGSL